MKSLEKVYLPQPVDRHSKSGIFCAAKNLTFGNFAMENVHKNSKHTHKIYKNWQKSIYKKYKITICSACKYKSQNVVQNQLNLHCHTTVRHWHLETIDVMCHMSHVMCHICVACHVSHVAKKLFIFLFLFFFWHSGLTIWLRVRYIKEANV